MTPNDLDSRLRQALTETTSAWQPTDRPAADVVGGVHRRRRRRRRSVMTIGSAVIVALAVGAGAFSYTTKTGNREASGAKVHSPRTPRGPGPTAAPGAPSLQEQGGLACVSVTLESGLPRCAGGYVATSLAAAGLPESSSAPGKANPALNPVSITVKVGQRVGVRLPAVSSGSWTAPVVLPPSALSPTLRREFAGSELSTQVVAQVGDMRVVAPAPADGKQSGSTGFEAVRAGHVVVTASLASACAPASDREATTRPHSCAGISARWILLVVIVESR